MEIVYFHIALYAITLCTSASVFVTSRSSIETDERIELVSACELSSADLTLCFKEILVSSKITVGYFSLELRRKLCMDLENFATVSRWCCRQNSSTVELVDHTTTVVTGRT